MATQTENRRDVNPLFAVVGVTDLAVARVRTAVANVNAAQAEAQKQIVQFDPRAAATEVPSRAVAVALETASKAEAQYEDLAKRGKELVERLRRQQATQDLLTQANNTLSRTKGAVTTARKSAEGTVTSVRSTLNVGRREVEAVAETAADVTVERAEVAGETTKQAAKKTAGTAKRNASATKSAAKGTRTSAAKTASAAKKAATDSAEKIGD